MSSKLLDDRDQIMRQIAVGKMKMKNLNEFKRQATKSILKHRAISELMTVTS
jgi:hypothetical protein